MAGLINLASIIMPLLQKQADQVELLAAAAVRCGYNALDVQNTDGIPVKANPSKLVDGMGGELGRWWYDLETGTCYVQGTRPEVRDMYMVLRQAATDD